MYWHRTITFFIGSFLAIVMIHAQSHGHNRSVRMWAEVQSSPPSITLKWLPHSNTNSFQVYRKLKGGTSWSSSIANLGSTALEFTDNSVEVGVSYEYKVVRSTANLGTGYGYVNVGIEVPAVENRGIMILVVDDLFTAPLASQLTQLQNDLEGDGWKVVRHDVSRNASVTTVKQLIVTTYNADPNNTKAVFLVGHVPVPYSGNLAPDGHGEHYGAWPADVYYGDVNGAWTDNSIYSTGAQWSRNHNVPGDGKFDQTTIPSAVELAVGRVDMYDLPVFSGQSETQLLANYLTKLSNWKRKLITAQFRGLVDDNFTGYTDAFSQNAWRGFGPFVHPSEVTSQDYFSTLSNQSYLWSYACGGGWFTGANGVGDSPDFNTNSLNTIFTFLFGSYFGDWDNQNNFLRAALGSGTTLTNIWAGYPNWYLHHMALGETIGHGTVLTQNNGNSHYEPANWQAGRIHIALMGDPTLRMHIVAPPTNVAATQLSASNVNISWTASAEPVIGYHVYRRSSSSQTWQRLNTNVITGTNYVHDASAYSGTVRYMVRALKLEEGFSGSYFNLSQGTMTQVDLGGGTPIDCNGVSGGSAMPGTSCDDGNACTTNDTWSSNCNCTGTPINCDDGNPCTSNNCVSGTCEFIALPDSDGDGACDATDGCPNDPDKYSPGSCGCGSPEPGMACDDGNVNTTGDVIGSDCACSGVLIDCLGVIGGSAIPGTSCDDGDPDTGNDLWTVDCNCAGQLYDCANVPGGSAVSGAPCSDGDPLTTGDTWTTDCTCEGTPADCAGDISGNAMPGTPCDDSDPNTGNDTWNVQCECAGEPIDCNGVPGGSAVLDNCGVCDGTNDCVEATICIPLTQLEDENPDGEESESGNVYLDAGDLDLVYDSEPDSWRGDQRIAMHFRNVQVPHGAEIINAYLQFTSHESADQEPCELNIAFQDSDDPEPLHWEEFNISSRPLTTSVPWAPPTWPQADVTGPDQRTPDLREAMQQVVDRDGWLPGNSMVVIIHGTGSRKTWSYDQSPTRAAQICVSYALPPPDCLGIPGGNAIAGQPCDDGDPFTGADTWNSDCTCSGLALDCAGIPGGTGYPGTPCDDGSASTANDQWTDQCECVGILIDCAGEIGGNDLPGTTCDDGDPNTVDDSWTTSCDCVGMLLDCLGIPGGPALPGTACDDGNASTGNDQWSTECNCEGELIDCEGVPGGTALPGSSCNDNDPLTGNDQWTASCGCAGQLLDCENIPGGTALPGTPCNDLDANTGNDQWTIDCTCEGELYDCQDVPGGMALPGTACDDGNASTVNDVWNFSCECTGDPIDCNGVVNGSAIIDQCGNCVGGNTGMVPDIDTDSDGVLDCFDNCEEVFNVQQADYDQDNVGDPCDNCPWVHNPDQLDDNGDGIGNACNEVGIAETGSFGTFIVHPNPTNGDLQFTGDVSAAGSIIVHDALGAQVMQLPFFKVIDLGSLAPGGYVIHVLGKDGTSIGRVRVVRL